MPTGPAAGSDQNPLTAVPTSPAVPSPAGGPPAGPMSIPLLPGDPTAARQLKFLLVNACTLANLVLGMVAIMLSFHGELRWAAACVLGCVAFDGLDGTLARRLGVASPFGAQMDSLADLCAFGIATPVLAYQWLQVSGAPSYAVAPTCVLVAVCAAVRLARFNVSPKDGRYFCGVPTTMAAAILTLCTLVDVHPVAAQVITVGTLALLMVSTFPYAKVTQLRRLPSWLWVPSVVGALINPPVAFVLFVSAYLGSGPVLWLKHRRDAVTPATLP